MYSTHMLQVHHLIKNIVIATEIDIGKTLEASMRSKVAFHNEEDRKCFYTSYEKNDDSRLIAYNHNKVTTIYCELKYRNLLDIHFLSAF